MKRIKRCFLITIAIVVLATQAAAVAPFKKVSIVSSTTPTATTSSTTTTTETPTAEADEAKGENGTASAGPTKNSKLTGIPQIDYIWDPNLPRELRGYNLSSYPFFATVPPDEDIHFKCDGLHDGFYSSIEHKCQVYHHCVYGIRHDFLCANFTAFDQKTFICHFVSDVDCEGSQKYWNRNDALYMATTTTSTTTTTTEPPPTPRRRPVRPQRPLRRPFNRRPVDDYYEEYEEYDDDYYEERMNHRRKQQRPRHRKPQLDYDDEYEEKRSFSDSEKPRRPSSRDRFRDTDSDVDDDYDTDRRKYDRPKGGRNKSGLPAERRKTVTRRPGTTALGRAGGDERRSFSDDRPIGNGRKDKPRTVADESSDDVDTNPRRTTNGNRRRINDKRPLPTASTAADIDDLDYYEKPQSQAHEDPEEVAEEEMPSKVKTTPKPLEKFITPKASSSSVYAQPRAPPRIARPVPVNEKKKFEYPVQKTTATTASPAASPEAYEDEEYDEYDEPPTRQRAPLGRRRIVDDGASKYDEDFPTARRRTHNDGQSQLAGRKPTRTALRKPFTDKRPSLAPADDDYDSVSGSSNERPEGRVNAGRKRPYNGRTRTSGRVSDDVDFVDDDYDEQPPRPAHRLRPKTLARKGPVKPRPPVDEEEELYEADPEPQAKHRAVLSSNGRNKHLASQRLRHPTGAEGVAHEDESRLESEPEDADAPATPSKTLPTTSHSGRPASVRVVKRPFLPSRGGSPYLPRGLQPVGVALRPLGGGAQTTDSTPIDMGSTISGVRLLEHGAPILRDSGGERDGGSEHLAPNLPRTTLPPRSALPSAVPQTRPESQPIKATLDELYENDYDVTLNDALNPTLKPLSPHPNHHHSNRNYASAYASSAPGAANPFVNNNQSPAIYHSISNNNNNNNNDNNYPQHHQITYQSLSPHQPQLVSQPQSQSQSSSLTHPIQNHNQQSPQQPHHHHHNHHHQQQQQHQPNVNNYNSDSYFSSTDIRRRAIIVPAPPAHPNRPAAQYRGVGTRIAQHFYDDFEY